MATLPIKHMLYNYKVLKYYLRGYGTPCIRFFSSKDTIDTDNAKAGLNEKEDKLKGEKQSDKKLNISSGANNSDQKKSAAKKKLFSLLSELQVSPDHSKIKPDLVLTKAPKRITKQERFADVFKEKKSPEDKIIEAVNAVAENLGEEAPKAQKELKQKLSSLHLISELPKSKQYPVTENLEIDEKVQEDLISSIKDIAETVPSPIKSKLTQRLLKLSVKKRDDKQTKISMESMMKGLKIEKPPEEPKKPAIPDVKLERRIMLRPRGPSLINIFQEKPLGIFSKEDVEIKEETEETMWEKLERKKLKLLTEFAPANAFEEMIMWTEQGKHWKFPIDNETEMGEEENVGFHEHVFLDQHLHGFPTKGPVRHFIELVAVGLSKNPYISVERKIENIDWFRDYFKEKEEILKQTGAIE